MDAFCERVWAHTADLRAAIAAHPFNAAVADGTLDARRFAFYLVQDAHYLLDFARVLDVAAALAPRAEDATLLADSGRNALEVERSLHTGYLHRLGIDVSGVAVSPTCVAYGSYLQAAALEGSFDVLVAALLPCYRIYQDVGSAIHAATRAVADHPYRAWIDTYADPGFAVTVAAMCDLADRCAASAGPDVAADMVVAFTRACEYEWMFWDSAWRQEGWPTAAWLPQDQSMES